MNGPVGAFENPAFAEGTKAVLEAIVEAITNANYIPGKDIAIAMDVAASEFYNPKTKKYELKNGIPVFYKKRKERVAMLLSPVLL